MYNIVLHFNFLNDKLSSANWDTDVKFHVQLTVAHDAIPLNNTKPTISWIVILHLNIL